MIPSRSEWRPSSAEIRGVYVGHNKLSVHSTDVYVLRSESAAIIDARHGETEAHWHPLTTTRRASGLWTHFAATIVNRFGRLND
jgi:hypothetical protein